ncbi:Rho-GTPase-activating protein 8 [Coemansia sp. RSA 1939]|nr:Rho-GTPase-activating protein 8 [Coemansia sp. RSA 1939]KAJ2616640.1 Rho-GTPase-activating protein 8 [Coemansia sp. RSA 1804]KAJ2683327.1 Rho-GTPase-activating protein 8 [Coemansia sp. RSA 1285]
MLKFETSFWDNPGHGHQPQYERGPQRLYEKLEQGSAECDELLGLFRERVAIEEAYATSLRKLSEREFAPQGFGRDEGATLKTAYGGLVAECLALAEAHSDMALELQSSVVMPLRSFSSEHRARVRASWKIMDDTIRKASMELGQVDRNRRVYTQKASAAEQMRLKEAPAATQSSDAAPSEMMATAEFEVKSRPSIGALSPAATPTTSTFSAESGSHDMEDEVDADVAAQRRLLSESGVGVPRTVLPQIQGELDVASIVLGNVALTRHEFHVVLQRMQAEIPQHDVKFGILGTFRGLISGESLAGWWCTNYPTVVRNETDSISVGQSLTNQGYLRLMGRGSQFQSRANAYYQWKRLALEFQSDDEGDSEDEPLGNRRAHLGKTLTYERAQREANEASQIYRDSVTRAELVRTDLEEQLTNYLDTMEVWELNRLMNIKSTFGEVARISKLPLQAELSISDRLEVYEESIKPQQDIQWAIEHYGTGRFTPRPIIFRPFGLSPAEYQIFGVPLDEQLLVSHKVIPLFPAKALSLIMKSSRQLEPHDRFSIWTTRALLRNIHELRNTVNRGSRVTLKQLRSFDLSVVANTLVLYFLELPQPLCPEELHGPLRAIYSTRSEKSTVETFGTIRTLISGISYSHLKTIQTLFGALSEIAKGGESSGDRDGFVKAVSQRLGPVILRGKEIVGVSVSRIPEIFVTDLVENYDDILADIEAKRPIKPIPPPIKNTDADILIQPEGTSASAENASLDIPSGGEGGLNSRPGRTSMDTRQQQQQRRSAEGTSSNTPKRISAGSSVSATGSNAGDVSAPAAPGTISKRGSTSSTSSNSQQQQQIMPNSADTLRSQNSFDVDERLIDNILEDANEVGGEADNMDFFLKDEDSDGSNDISDDETDSNSVDASSPPAKKKNGGTQSNSKKSTSQTS